MARLSHTPGLDGLLIQALMSGAGVDVSGFGTVRPLARWLRRLSPGVPVTDPVAIFTLEWIRDWQDGG